MSDNNLLTTIQDAGDYYIHLNKIHIGSRSNRQNLTRSFVQQKKAIAAQVKSNYIQYFNANLSNSSVEAMAAATGMTEEDFLTVLNNDLSNKLQKELTIDKLQQLHTITKNGNLNQHLQKAIKQESVEDLSNTLGVIAEALKLLENDTDGSLGALLLNTFKDKELKNFQDVGVKLQNLLKDYEVKNNYRKIKKQALEGSKKQLENLAYALKKGRFKTSQNALSAKGLSTLLLNGIISTQIAEGLSLMMNNKAGNLLHKSVIEGVGTQSVKVHLDDQIDKTIPMGKVDVKASKVNLSMQGYDGGESKGDILIDIGISSKFYAGQSFNSNLKDFKGVYSSGSGGTLGQALKAIWGDSVDRYLTYNFFTHEMFVPQFNDLIATRQILRLFSTAGSEDDFAQFMLVNGKIISVWDLVKYAVSSDLSVSQSMEEEKAGIVLSIPNRSKIFSANQKIQNNGKEKEIAAAWRRSRKVNSAINSTRIKAELRLRKLAAAYG